MANTADILKKLEGAMPVMDEQRKRQAEAARAIQLQRTVQAAPTIPTVRIPTAAQAVGAGQAQVAGQQALQAQQTQAAQAQQIAGQAAQAQQTAQQQQISQAQIAEQAKQIATESEIAKVGQTAEDKIFQAQIQFQRDETGRAELQGNQLYDFAVANAKSDEDLKNKLQEIDQSSKERLQYLDSLNAKLKTMLQGEFQIKGQKLSQKSQEYIRDLQRRIGEEADKARTESIMRSSMYTALGGVVGGVVGGVIGGVLTSESGYWGVGPGATLGAGAGGALGASYAAGTA